MRDLSREALDHDNPNSRRHHKDKREKRERDDVGFIPVPSPLRGGGKELTGTDFDADSAGFMFSFGGRDENAAAALGETALPPAALVNPAVYRKRILGEEKERRRFRRVVVRGEKEVETWGRHKCGGSSLVVSVPPWAMSVINTLEDDQRDALLLRVAHSAAKRMQEVSGRVPWGGGCHLDTDVTHYHFQIPKTSPSGDNLPKSQFRTGGPWLVGADRVERKFPGLLNPKQKELMEGHKQRKGEMVDLEIAAAVDTHLEKEFLEMGLEKDYKQACREYVHRKKRAQETERQRGILRESLRFFVVEGVWPLASGVMKLSMWRMLPPEFRPLISQSIRVSQVIASPTRAAISLTANAIRNRLKEELFPEPEPVPPLGKF